MWFDGKNESFNAKCTQNNILGEKNANFTSELQNNIFRASF